MFFRNKTMVGKKCATQDVVRHFHRFRVMMMNGEKSGGWAGWSVEWIRYLVWTLTFLLTLCRGGSYGLPMEKVGVLPFSIHSETDFSYLQKGVETMLRARLEGCEGMTPFFISEESGGTEVSEKNSLEQGIQEAKRLSADFLILGDITIIGENASTDIRLVELTSGNTVCAFHRIGEKKGAVLIHVDAFATEVIDYFSTRSASVSPSTEKVAPPRQTTGTFITKRGPSLEMEVVGLTVGRVTGGSSMDVVVAGKQSIAVYRDIMTSPEKLCDHKEKSNLRILGVDLADIDGNGRDELYVTCMHKNTGHLTSYAAVWKENALYKKGENLKWFFRVIDDGAGGKRLVGQERGYNADVFKEGIYEMVWNDDGLEPGKKLDLPEKAAVFGLQQGDVSNDSTLQTVRLKKDGHLSVYGRDGNHVWTSPVVYGGSENYIFYNLDSFSDDRLHYYLPQRVYVADMDRDGKNELVVASNHDVTNRLFARLRHFDTGRIEGLSRNALGFTSMWKTQAVSGYISDYWVGDINGDKRPDLLYGVVESSGGVFSRASSYLVLMEYHRQRDIR